MRIVFIGAVQFSEKVLAKLIDIKADVVGVCTLEKSLFNADHVDLTPLCKEKNIPVRYTPDINSNKSIDWIKSLDPEVIFCFGWSYLLKCNLLKLAELGVVGYHPAALPANRGRHPLIWALVLGLDKTASTFFFMDEGTDSGDILSQIPITISDIDDACTLYQRITETALEQIGKFVPELETGDYQRIQQDHNKANYWRKRGKKDGQIDWRISAKSIHNLVRGLTKPYVGAHFELEGEKIKVWKTAVVENSEKNIEPGTVIKADKSGTIIKAGEDSILLLKTDPALEIQPGSYL